MNKLPWKIGELGNHVIVNDSLNIARVCYEEDTEFIVTACNAYEANQATITHLQAQLEKCREALKFERKICNEGNGSCECCKIEKCGIKEALSTNTPAYHNPSDIEVLKIIKQYATDGCYTFIKEVAGEALEAMEGNETK